jgi:hypothetical protein
MDTWVMFEKPNIENGFREMLAGMKALDDGM